MNVARSTQRAFISHINDCTVYTRVPCILSRVLSTAGTRMIFKHACLCSFYTHIYAYIVLRSRSHGPMQTDFDDDRKFPFETRVKDRGGPSARGTFAYSNAATYGRVRRLKTAAPSKRSQSRVAYRARPDLNARLGLISVVRSEGKVFFFFLRVFRVRSAAQRRDIASGEDKRVAEAAGRTTTGAYSALQERNSSPRAGARVSASAHLTAISFSFLFSFPQIYCDTHSAGTADVATLHI